MINSLMLFNKIKDCISGINQNLNVHVDPILNIDETAMELKNIFWDIKKSHTGKN